MEDAQKVSLTALKEIRERHTARSKNAQGLGADPSDFRCLLAALEAVLKEAARLDSGFGDYGHLVNRHETAAAFREAVTRALAGK